MKVSESGMKDRSQAEEEAWWIELEIIHVRKPTRKPPILLYVSCSISPETFCKHILSWVHRRHRLCWVPFRNKCPYLGLWLHNTSSWCPFKML